MIHEKINREILRKRRRNISEYKGNNASTLHKGFQIVGQEINSLCAVNTYIGSEKKDTINYWSLDKCS